MVLSALFVCEGTSDLFLADLVEELFLDSNIQLKMSRPDYSLLEDRVESTVAGRLEAGVKLLRARPDIAIVHRDADSTSVAARKAEIMRAADRAQLSSEVLCVVPVRMTEAWLLLDEQAIRVVSGNPRGRASLPMPKLSEVESVSDPKALLQDCLLAAADVSGRRRQRLQGRFAQNRRQLAERIDRNGPIVQLPSYQDLVAQVQAAARTLSAARDIS